MKKFLLALAVSAFALNASATWYLSGGFNGWGELELQDNGDGTYSTTVAKMTTGFKVRLDNWDDEYGAKDGAALIPGEVYTLAPKGQCGNIEFPDFVSVNNANVVFDLTAQTLLITGDVEEAYCDLWLPGNWPGAIWSGPDDGAPAFVRKGSKYYLNMEDLQEGDYEFKVAGKGWAPQLCFEAGAKVGFSNDNRTITLVPNGSNAWGHLGGNYTVIYNALTRELTFGEYDPTATDIVEEPEQIADNYFVYTGGLDIADNEADMAIPTQWYEWWNCKMTADIEDETVLGGVCLSFASGANNNVAFSYGINQGGDEFNNGLLRPLYLYFLAKTEAANTKFAVKLTANNADAEVGANETGFDIEADGEWHLITMNVELKFPEVWENWLKNTRGYVFSIVGTNASTEAGEGLIYVGPIWYAAENTVYTPGAPVDPENPDDPDTPVDPEDGLEVINADSATAVYYNLQGVRVANPEAGIFVRVIGGKAVKVVK